MPNSYQSLNFLLIFSFLTTVSSLNILFHILLIGKSHIDYTDSLINALIERGHTVDLIIGRMNSHVKTNGSSKPNRLFVYGFENESPWSKVPHLIDPFKKSQRSFKSHEYFIKIATETCEKGLSDPNLHNFMKSRQYHVAIATQYDFCAFALFHHYTIPSIASANALAVFDQQSIHAGLPNIPSVTHMLMDVEDLNTITGRFWNLLHWANLHFIVVPHFLATQKPIIQKYLNKSLNLHQIIQNLDLIFVNANEIIERPRPVSHKIKYIGGINLRSPKPLKGRIAELVSRQSQGVIVFCFGTQVPSHVFPKHVRHAFVDAFKQFPQYTFIWKYEQQPDDEHLFDNITNLHLTDWMPQTDLLYNPRTVAFISHTGLNSYVEASYAGVPIIAVPLFVDQPHNALSGEALGTTYILDKTKISTEEVVKALKAVLHDKSYSTNSKRISKMLLNRPNPPKQQFVEWVEFIAANPLLHKQFHQPGTNFTPFVYYCIDVILLITAVLTIILIISGYIIKKVFNLLRVNIRVLIKKKIQ